jgi:transcriptional regulator with XRE-family HTH domain
MADKEAARTALRDFLMSRRARITPEAAGLSVVGTNRRVKGLRREEVAMLAGISSEYYVRFERGVAAGATSSVIDSVAAVLKLDETEREHLNRLMVALSPQGRKRNRPATPDAVRPGIQLLLDAMAHVPAFVLNGRLDLVAANNLGKALYAPIFEMTADQPNMARFMFLHEEAARAFWPRWQDMAGDVVAFLRTEAGLHPDDPDLIDLVGHLSTRSDEFRTRWAAHNVRPHTAGTKTLHHPLIGELTMPYEDLGINAAPGHLLMAYTPRAGTPEHDALRMLASWNASVTVEPGLSANGKDQDDRPAQWGKPAIPDHR